MTVSVVGRAFATGVNGPGLTVPFAVAMKKFTTEPLVKFEPLMVNVPPTRITFGMLLMKGGTGTGVNVGLGFGVLVGVRVGVRVGVGVGVRVGV